MRLTHWREECNRASRVSRAPEAERSPDRMLRTGDSSGRETVA